MFDQEVSTFTEKFVKTHDVREVEANLDGQNVRLFGWVYTKRTHGNLIFISLRDSTGLIQVAIHKGQVTDADFNRANESTLESSVGIEGTVRADERAPKGVEIRCRAFHLISPSLDEYPIKLGVGKDLLLDNRHLHLRSPKVGAILSVKSAFSSAARDWFHDNDFQEVHCPILITAACEGGATLFPVEYFKRKAYLSQSVQLYQETAIMAFEKVYSIEPSFRAEISRTRRHLTEFWQIEAEVANASLEDIMRVQEELLAYTCAKVVENCDAEFRFLKKRFKPLKPPFPKITYSEAIDRLHKLNIPIEWGDGLGADEERALSKEFNTPFFIMNYPRKSKAFYHKPHPDDPKLTLSADLLAPNGQGEIAGGGQRIDDYDELIESMELFQLNPKDYQWYIDLRKYGSVVHSGFGLGIERTVQWILKLPHIRDVSLYPRTPTRVYP